MRIVLNFPPDNWFITIFLWVISTLFFVRFYKLYKYRETGVTIVYRMKRVGLFHTFPGKLTKNQILKKVNRYTDYAYWSKNRTIAYSLFFLATSIFAFLMSFIIIQDIR